jgi:hypothetical protein
MITLALAYVAAMTSPSPCASLPCRCTTPNAEISQEQLTRRQRDDAAAIFSGAVVRIDSSHGAFRAIIRVDQVWKAEIGDTVAVTFRESAVRISSCEFRPSVGLRYIVFAYGQPGGLSMQKCRGTQQLTGNDDVLAVLGPGRRPR